MNQLSQTYEFMTADYKGLLADDSLESVEWLLPMAIVEREALRREISEGQLLHRRHEVEDPAVQHALDILEAGGFIEPVSAE
jgi:DNA-binding MarR family transcriptional regulator